MGTRWAAPQVGEQLVRQDGDPAHPRDTPAFATPGAPVHSFLAGPFFHLLPSLLAPDSTWEGTGAVGAVPGLGLRLNEKVSVWSSGHEAPGLVSGPASGPVGLIRWLELGI